MHLGSVSLRESCIRENRLYSLSGGRWPARKRATSDPTPTKQPNEGQGGPKEGCGGKAVDQGERGSAQPVPDAESGERAKRAGTRAGSGMNASTPESEVGTVCVSSASTGLYGGRPVMDVPTVTRVETFLDTFEIAEISDARDGSASDRPSLFSTLAPAWRNTCAYL